MSALIEPDAFQKSDLGSPAYTRNLIHPDLKKIRGQVLKTLIADVDAMLRPLGYQRKGTTWEKESEFGRSIFELQKDWRGFGIFINAGTLILKTAPDSSLMGRVKGFSSPILWEQAKRARPKRTQAERPPGIP